MTDIVETIADCLVEDHIGLMKELAAMTQERDELKLAYEECSRQRNELLNSHKKLAAAQARIKELREHLALAVLYGPPMAIGNVLSKDVLALPKDTTALDALLEEAYSNGYDVGCAATTGDM